MPIIGAQSAFVSQLNWQLKNGWDKQRSIEAWHKNHPDISDDKFEQLYAIAQRCQRMTELCKEPFINCTLGELWNRAN